MAEAPRLEYYWIRREGNFDAAYTCVQRQTRRERKQGYINTHIYICGHVGVWTARK